MPVSSETTVEPSVRVLDSARFISEHSKDVFVPAEGIRQAAKEILERMKSSGYSTAEWKKHPLNPSTADEAAIEWIFVVDSLNFSFWTSKPVDQQYAVTLDGTTYRGYWTLCAAINRAVRRGLDITDAAVYGCISRQVMEEVFRTDDPQSQERMPMLERRIQVLHEVGRVLIEKYAGKFGNVIRACQGSAQKLIETVVREFPCFRDEHEFNGQKVCIYKRAQILVADIWACFEGRGLGRFDDIDKVTMFADYRVPQGLYHFGALRYSPRLFDFLQRSETAVKTEGEREVAEKIPLPGSSGLLPSGHPWEIEIRGNSIWAVECIRQQILKSSGVLVSAILIDFYMWDYSKLHAEAMKDIPIHFTRSVFY
ncbi:hypothetical protein LPJ75_004016 [Coemansia sp. RSA 2598]|nr:hypothetical protein LPJ75_004016 [Coemansia sp. RSA 2598]